MELQLCAYVRVPEEECVNIGELLVCCDSIDQYFITDSINYALETYARWVVRDFKAILQVVSKTKARVVAVTFNN